MGEDEVWVRHCRHCHIIVVACEGRRVRSGWVRMRDGRGAVVVLLLLSLLLHVRVGEDEAWARHHCCCRVWREGGRAGYENPCHRYGYKCYDFFPLPRLFPHLCSTTSLLLFCSFLLGDRSILTCFPILFLSSCTSPLVLPCSTGLSHSLVTSLVVTVFPLPST